MPYVCVSYSSLHILLMFTHVVSEENVHTVEFVYEDPLRTRPKWSPETGVLNMGVFSVLELI